MTPNEFRGFIANLIINAIVISALTLSGFHWPVWAYWLIGVALAFVFPITGYHPSAAEIQAERLRKLGQLNERNSH